MSTQTRREKKFKKSLKKHLNKIKPNVIKGWRGGGGGQPMWIIIEFYNIIIKIRQRS